MDEHYGILLPTTSLLLSTVKEAGRLSLQKNIRRSQVCLPLYKSRCHHPPPRTYHSLGVAAGTGPGG